MKIGKFKKKLNKWQFEIGFIRSWEVLPKAWRFRIAIVKITRVPEEGERIKKEKHYKGIFWESRIIWHPLTLLRRFLDRLGY